MKKYFFMAILFFVGFVGFSQVMLPLADFKNATNFLVTREIALNECDTLSMEKYQPMMLFEAEDIANLYYDASHNLVNYCNHTYTFGFYDPKNPIEVNGMKLHKVIEFAHRNAYSTEKNAFDEYLGPGLCYYANIDPEFQKNNTYFGMEKVMTIFDGKGNQYLLYESHPILLNIDPQNSINIKNGATSKDSHYMVFINYVDEETKSVMSYNIASGKYEKVQNLPKMKNPKLYFGLPRKDAKSVNDLALVKVEDETYIENGELKRKNLSGRKYWYEIEPKTWDYVYIVDHSSNGKPKSDVYYITGNSAEKVTF